MKKKIINGLLLVAMIVGTTSSFVSCKDYDDETNVRFTSNINTLRDALQAQIDGLKGEIDALKAAQALCETNCSTERAKLAARIALLEAIDHSQFATKTDLENAKTDVLNQVAATYATKADLDAVKTDLTTLVNNLKSEIAENYATKAELEAVKTALSEDITAVAGRVTTLETSVANLETTIETVQNDLAGVETRLGIAEETLAQAVEDINTLNGDIILINTTIDDLKDRVETLEGDVEALDEVVGNLVAEVLLWPEQLEEVRQLAQEAKTQAETNAQNITAMQGLIEELQGHDAILDAQIEDIIAELEKFATKAEVEEVSQKADRLYLQAKAYADSLAQGLGFRVDTLSRNVNARIADVQNAINEKYNELKGDIETLQDDLTTLGNQVNDNKVAIEKLTGAFNENIAKFISGIIVEPTYSPAIGYLNTPLGIKSTVLAAYWGETAVESRFPITADAAGWVGSALTAEEWNAIRNANPAISPVTIPAGVRIVDESENNAGTLYLTVNPTNRDFTGTEFTIVNSQNQASPVQLSYIKKTDRVLDFGYTRAGIDEQSENGFYEAGAKLNAEDIDAARMRFDIGGVASEIKSELGVARAAGGVRSGLEAINLSKLAATLYSSMTNVLDASAVKATWTAGEGDDAKTYSVSSEYSVAATAVKPLGFNFAKDLTFNTNLFDRVQSLYDRVKAAAINRIKLPENFVSQFVNTADLEAALNGLEIAGVDQIKLGKLDPESDEYDPNWLVFTIDVTFPESVGADLVLFAYNEDMDEWYPVYGLQDDGYYHFPYTIELPLDLDDVHQTISVRDAIEDILGQLNGSLEGFNGSIEQLNDVLSTLNDFIAQINDVDAKLNEFVDGAVQGVFNRLDGYVTRALDIVNRGLKNFVSNINTSVQPIMLARVGNDKFRLIRGTQVSPNEVSTKVTFIPTSYTAELLAPAYKKLLAVTEAIDANGNNNADAVKKANESNKAQLAQILNGGKQYIDVEFEAGYTYKVTYVAIDYAGYSVKRNYYVRVR